MDQEVLERENLGPEKLDPQTQYSESLIPNEAASEETETKTVDTHIKRLRDKIEQAGYDPGLVETVRGYGYRFKQ